MVVKRCICGIKYDNKNPLDHLDKVNINSSGDRIPCRTCINAIVNNTVNKSFITCFVCKKDYTKRRKEQKNCEQRRLLVKHILSFHVESAPYKCEICAVKKKNKTTLKSHLRIHSNQNKEKCNFCNKVLNKQYLKQHIEVFHSDHPPVFLCPVCGAVFHTERNYEDHLQKFHEDLEYQCPKCEKKYPSKRQLITHRHVHKKKPSMKKESIDCELCGKKILKKSLKSHMMSKHETSQKKYRCEYCETVFKSKLGRDKHVNEVHTVGNVYKCETCEKSFPRSQALKRHIVTHTGEKKFKCDTCGVSFNQKCTLTRHQVVHTGEKPFECEICGQRFTQKPYMKTHEKKHKEGEVVMKKQKKKKRQESSEESEEDMSEESEEDMSEESIEDMSEEEDMSEGDKKTSEESEESSDESEL